MRHISGVPRQQQVLFPESLDEYISADNPVRFIDAFVDSLDLADLGFAHTELAETGRPPDAAGFLLFSKQFGSRGLQPGLDLPQAGIGLARSGETQPSGRPGPIPKGHRQPDTLDGQGQVHHVGDPFLVDPPLALHGYAQLLQPYT